MNHREVIKQVARRFPDLTQQQIAEVFEVLVEVWSGALTQSNDVVIRDFGRLAVEVQQMKNSGAIRAQMGAAHRTNDAPVFSNSTRLAVCAVVLHTT